MAYVPFTASDPRSVMPIGRTGIDDGEYDNVDSSAGAGGSFQRANTVDCITFVIHCVMAAIWGATVKSTLPVTA